MKPWIKDKDWFDKYAAVTARLKGNSNALGGSPEAKVANSLRVAFERVYRVVAFDIDGTLTEENAPGINQTMAAIVGRLLQRGIPVILITGRGRSTTREAARQIREISGLNAWYLRRLTCVTHNRVFILATPSGEPGEFLRVERVIAPELDDPTATIDAIQQIASTAGLSAKQVAITQEPHSIRLVFKDIAHREAVAVGLQNLVKELCSASKTVYLSSGTYAQTFAFDLVCTNKKHALASVADVMGVSPEKILRIGDQGQEGGNDYDLLDSSGGFSVGEFSSNLDHCFPVLDELLQTPLKGAAATERLLSLTTIFPPISILGTHHEDRLTALRKFERLALKRSREESDTTTQRLRVRLKYLLPQHPAVDDVQHVNLSDLYDPNSGGIKLRDWELDSLPIDHPSRDLFEIPNAAQSNSRPPQSKWSMFTDTGILMRGPIYYYGLTCPQDHPVKDFEEYCRLSKSFLVRAMTAIERLLLEQPDLTRYKLVLAVQDNVRNILLNFLNVAFVAETVSGSSCAVSQEIFRRGVAPHTDQHFDALLNPDVDWTASLMRYSELLRSVVEWVPEIEQPVAALITEWTKRITSSGRPLKKKLFGWRECDHFLQNVAAVQLGLHQFRQIPEVRQTRRLVCVGLASGGIELPAIASTIARVRGFVIAPALARVSIYGDKEIGMKVREGEHDYVADLLRDESPLCIFPTNTEETLSSVMDETTVLMDDNCTTGVTLQFARDFLVALGADVVGAIVVRFPSVNRHVQMALPNHGFPDPEILFSFIRGLVSPSPYTRLLFPNSGANPYLDQRDMFDKAKERIKSHLSKNGTDAVG